MKIANRRGITISSLVIYIVLFTSFTIFVSNVSSNMNERLFNSRGEAVIYSNFNKLQYNIDNSSIQSYDVTVTANEINYSNGDSYEYDSENKLILKNGGILCQNVDSFTVSLEEGVDTKKITMQIVFKKYLSTMERTIISCVEEF